MRKGGITKQPLSLRARGVQLLSQREHSVSELRTKLQRHARALDAFDATRRVEEVDPDVAEDSKAWGTKGHEPTSDSALAEFGPPGEVSGMLASQNAVDAVDDALNWLQAKGYLSDARFAQSRVDVRSARFGNLRIRQELALHQVELTPEAAKQLQTSELERAVAVLKRKYAQPTTALDAAKQARFLRQRGFSSDVIRQALRASADVDIDDSET
jgi:regulatory protein